jgi:hypothetical protein
LSHDSYVRENDFRLAVLGFRIVSRRIVEIRVNRAEFVGLRWHWLGMWSARWIRAGLFSTIGSGWVLGFRHLALARVPGMRCRHAERWEDRFANKAEMATPRKPSD